MKSYLNDIRIFNKYLKNLPINWDGKECIIELKKADYNWRQMEWWGFYFEYKVIQLLSGTNIQIPGEKFGNVTFDLKGTINWDMKTSAIKSDSHKIILNDINAMNESIKNNKYHGEIIALCDVEYNDANRTFQKWHNRLKGGLSDYEKERKERTSISRYRKTKAILTELLYVIFNKEKLDYLDIMKQGRNSNGNPREPKYMLDLEKINLFEHQSLKF